jgi:hypothetical protein
MVPVMEIMAPPVVVVVVKPLVNMPPLYGQPPPGATANRSNVTIGRVEG